MTYSILAFDPATGALGAAVASRFFAVGALCTHVDGRVGAVATQALVNPMYGPVGLALLRQGASAADTVAGLVGPDVGRDQRQVHVMDAAGRHARHTGTACVGWAGDLAGIHVSVAGNMLAGPAVLPAMLAGFDQAGGPIAERLIAALQAGEAAGGDKRGRQSAAVRVHTNDPVADLDLRADDHPDPLGELRRLYGVSRGYYAVFRRHLAGRDDPVGELDRAIIQAAVAREGGTAA